MNARELSLEILLKVFRDGRSLSEALRFPEKFPAAEQGLVKNLCFGVCRYWPRLQVLTQLCLSKPLKRADLDIELAIVLGLFQLLYTRTPDHAVVSTTVDLAKFRKKIWATSLINAILRRFGREQEALLKSADAKETARFAHPDWMIRQIRQAWPEQWEAILLANNEFPPLHLRVNTRKISRDDYLARLEVAKIAADPAPFASSAVMLEEKLSVEEIPGFFEGLVSVQDLGAQLSAFLLDPQPGERILDACAAPGGKAVHILELQPTVDLTAVDNDPARAERIHENFKRVLNDSSQNQIITADIFAFAASYTGPLFDRILLDAPCSATGVIRRHPDIKIHRQQSDIPALSRTQLQMLEAVWNLLKPGGKLLYVTCSILPAENEYITGTFAERHVDCECQPIHAEWGIALPHGRQCIPTNNQMDGFYFSLLRKRA